jgi:cell division protein FtsA
MSRMRKTEELVVGLDIGTTKICCIIGEITDEGVDIIGIGTSPSKGLRKGVVINIESTVNSIKKAVDEAEFMAGVEVGEVYAGIAGGHVKGLNSHGIVGIKGDEVTHEDVDRVVDAAKAVNIPMEREVIHVIAQEFIIDGQGNIKDPVGMSGVRLEAKVHIVTGAVTSAQNIIKCANRCGLHVSDIALEQVASAESVLSIDEKELGVAVVDIGGGTTDIAIFSGGAVVHTSVLSLGGNHLTNDVAVGLRTPMAEAEKLKQIHGCAMVAMVDGTDMIPVESVGGRSTRNLPRKILCDIIEPRVEEIFALVGREIQLSGYEDQIPGGVVITGGSSSLHGMPELAEAVLKCPVRRGTPGGIGGLVDNVRRPKFATGVGLVLYGAKSTDQKRFKIRDEKIYEKITNRMKVWFEEIF